MIIKFRKGFCHLFPDGGHVLFGSFLIRRCRIEITFFVVMMHVDDYIKIFFNSPADYFFDPLHPCCRNLIVFIHMIVPADRNTNEVKSGIFDLPDQCTGCFDAAPHGFNLKFIPVEPRARIVRIKCVAQIPSCLQFADEPHRIIIRDFEALHF